VSKSSNWDTAEARGRRSDAPMDMAMEMAMAVTHITADTASTATLEPTESNKNMMRRRQSEALGSAIGPRD